MSRELLWLVGGAAEARYVARITDVLSAEHHLESVMLAPLASTHARLRDLGHSCLGLDDILAKADSYSLDSEKLIEKANLVLRGLDINMLLHSDQLLYLFVDRRAAQTFVARAIVGIHQLLSLNHYAGCLRYGTGGAVGRGTSILTESLGITSYALCGCPVADTCGLMPVGLDEQWRWKSFPRSWQIWQNTAVPEFGREAIERYIASYFEWHRARPRAKFKLEKPKASRALVWWKRFRNRFIPQRQPGHLEEKSEIVVNNRVGDIDLDALLPLWESYLHGLRSRWLETYQSFDYDHIPARYVYMPLNFKWDAPHRAWNPMNHMQEYLVQVVAASLPYSYQLVVKEHPYGLGDPSHQKLKELQDIGVRVVAPDVHSLELVKNAEAVFCVGDTTGWEAILFKVPVVVFGARPFYTEYPYLWAIADPNQVHHALREAVKSKHKAYSNENLWYSFIHSVFESSYPGQIWGYKGTLWSDVDESEENLKRIAYMIAKEGEFST